MNIFDIFDKIGSTADKKKPIAYIIAGLGNPGKEYENTRHNMGFMALDHIAEKCGVLPNRARFHALCAEADLGPCRVLLMKPQTYMNNSGVAVAEAMQFYKLSPEQLIVLCDDISFAPGRMRIRKKGSAGGHNGLKSIIEMTGSQDFMRFRLGVGQKPSPDYDLADWVLGRFGNEDRKTVDGVFQSVYEALLLTAEGKTDLAMTRYSG